ncbi:hypothetical protein GCM10020000_03550 [Streptomyces olivoverticillatus]
MTIDELKALITRHTQDTTLTLPAADLGTGPAAALVGTWLDGTLTVTDLQREDHDDRVTVHGTLTVTGLGLTDLPVHGIEFGLDPLDHDPTLHVPLVVPADWTFATSFPGTDGSELAALAFPVPPALLLTSAARPARDGYPALDPGLTFHASQVTDPAQLGSLAALLRPRPGELSLTGPVVRRPAKGPGGEVRTDIALRSTPRPDGEFSASFCLWASSRDDGANGSAVTYGLRLAADLVLGQVGGATISAPLLSGGGVLALSADRLPERLSPRRPRRMERHRRRGPPARRPAELHPRRLRPPHRDHRHHRSHSVRHGRAGSSPDPGHRHRRDHAGHDVADRGRRPRPDRRRCHPDRHEPAPAVPRGEGHRTG